MAVYEITSNQLKKIPETNFASEGIKEREDLQRLLKDQIEIISPDTLVISEEFGEWDESRRRIDLLGIDKSANIIVIELKRTEDGGHMELQAIRYAAMVSTLTFDRVIEIYDKYLRESNNDADARECILGFLECGEVDEDKFAQDVQIVLASAEFSKELTTAVMWLNNRNLDIRCVRLQPYKDGARTLLDVQQVIPLPEAEEYQIQIREKQQKERTSRTQSRDQSKYSIIYNDDVFVEGIRKSDIGLKTVEVLEANGLLSNEIIQYLKSDRSCNFQLLKTIDDVTDNEERYGKYRVNKEPEIFYDDVGYYVARNWGKSIMPKFIEKMSDKFSGLRYKKET